MVHRALHPGQVPDHLRRPRPPPVRLYHGSDGHRDGGDAQGRDEAARDDVVENLEVADGLLRHDAAGTSSEQVFEGHGESEAGLNWFVTGF